MNALFDRINRILGILDPESQIPENPVIPSNSSVPIRNFHLLLLIVAVACTWVFQCAKAPTVADPGGGSMEVVVSLDGNLVDRDGDFAAGTAVYLRPKDYLAPIPAKLSALQAFRTMDSTYADSLGHFAFDSIAAGTYMLECLDGEGNGALIDSVVVTNPDSILRLATDTLKPLGAISGQIQMPENLSASQISVLVYGLDRLVTPDSMGGYTISGLAEGTYSLRIQILGSQGMDVHGTKVTSGGTTLSSKAILPGTDKISATRASGTIAIDGKFDEADWDSAQSIYFGRPGYTENRIAVRTLWDNANLYVSYEVEDTLLATDTTRFLNSDDAVEFFLDPAHDPDTTTNLDGPPLILNTMNTDDIQFQITISKEIGIHRAKDTTTITGPVSFAIDTTSAGYSVEISIPWSFLGKSPVSGMTMGALFGNDDFDSGFVDQIDWLDLRSRAAISTWKNPRYWGDLILE